MWDYNVIQEMYRFSDKQIKIMKMYGIMYTCVHAHSKGVVDFNKCSLKKFALECNKESGLALFPCGLCNTLTNCNKEGDKYDVD